MLVDQHFVAQQQADDARTASDAAQAGFHAAQAGLELARRALADASLYAPDNGIIQERILEPGDMASPQRPVYTLAMTDPLWVRVYVKESDLGRIRPGMRAEVATDSYPEQALQRLAGLHLADRRIHAEIGGDHRSAQQPGLPGAHLRMQPAGRIAPRHAGHGNDRAGPTRRHGQRALPESVRLA